MPRSKPKRKPRFSKAAMRAIRSIAKQHSVDLHEAGRMYVQRGY